MRSRSTSARFHLRDRGQLRIKVAASTVNPMDLHLATGTPGIVRLVEGFRRPKHEIPGREACGVVDQLGPGVTDFEIGQSVFGWLTGAIRRVRHRRGRPCVARSDRDDRVRERRAADCRRELPCKQSNSAMSQASESS